MNAHVRALPLLLAAASVGCGSPGPDVMLLHVAEVRAACRGFVPTECLLVWNQDARQWHYFATPIQGFTHQFGTRYVLRVEVRAIRNPPLDGSSVEYRLREVVSAEPSPHAARIEQIRAAELVWAGVRPAGPPWSYRMVMERICDCPQLGLVQVDATRFWTEPPRYAEDIVAITDVATGQPLQSGFQNGFRSVWDLFGIVYHALIAADDVSVEFHETLGYPTRVAIDPFAHVHGDGVVFVVHSLDID